MAKSKFQFKNNFAKNFNDILESAEENIGSYEKISQNSIPIDHIVIASNPRRLIITKKDILDGFNEKDLQYEKKNIEYNELTSLSESIRDKGVLHDIHVYKKGDNFILITGQRRVLASIIANKKTIPAKIWKLAPKDEEISLYQWIENFNRTDLSLLDVIDSASNVINSMFVDKKSTVREAAKILYCSKSKAAYFCNLRNLKPEVRKSIQQDKIQSLKIAAEINRIEDNELRKYILDSNVNLTEDNVKKIKEQYANKSRKKTKKRKVAISSGVSIKTAHLIIEKLLEFPCLIDLKSEYKKDTNDYTELSQLFKKAIKILESN